MTERPLLHNDQYCYICDTRLRINELVFTVRLKGGMLRYSHGVAMLNDCWSRVNEQALAASRVVQRIRGMNNDVTARVIPSGTLEVKDFREEWDETE